MRAFLVVALIAGAATNLLSQVSAFSGSQHRPPSSHRIQKREEEKEEKQSKAYELAWENVYKDSKDIGEIFDPSVIFPDPQSIIKDPKKIRFLLYSDAENPEEYEEIEFENKESLQKSKYKLNKPLKLLIHGFQMGYEFAFPQNAKNAYLAINSEEENNVIIVDWSELSMKGAPHVMGFAYPIVVSNVAKVGERSGAFVAWLIRESVVDPHDVHIVGFSLGSHASGKAGDVVKANTSKPVGRVTALDPAGPAYFKGIAARKLTPNDAEWVDVIHTNAGILGTWEDLGQADYYVNGGTFPQPGCFEIKNPIAAADSALTSGSGFCDHFYAAKIFTRTILEGQEGGKKEFCACQDLKKYEIKLEDCCDTKVHFGAYVSVPSSKGTFYLNYDCAANRKKKGGKKKKRSKGPEDIISAIF